MANWDNRQSQRLWRAILSLRTADEAKRFFRDLLTPQEIEEFSRRWQAAQLLDDGVSYVDIVNKTGVSSTTVARISRWLNGPMGGYRLLLRRQRIHPMARVRRRRQ